jgi:hypothetical protein
VEGSSEAVRRLRAGDIVRFKDRDVSTYPLVSRVTGRGPIGKGWERPNVLLEDEAGRTCGAFDNELALVTFCLTPSKQGSRPSE